MSKEHAMPPRYELHQMTGWTVRNHARPAHAAAVRAAVASLVLAGLGWLLFPVFYHPCQSARSTSCQSNLKILGVAFALYAEDYDGRLPLATTGPLGAGRIDGWVGAHGPQGVTAAQAARGSLAAYERHAREPHFHCPNDPVPDALSYAANARLFTRPVAPGLLAGIRIKDADEPGAVYLLAEAEGPAWSRADGLLRPGLQGPSPRHPDRQPGRTNLLFLDGHVKQLTVNEVASPTAPHGWNPRPWPALQW